MRVNGLMMGAALVLALFLAGCSGSSSSPTPGGTTPTPASILGDIAASLGLARDADKAAILAAIQAKADKAGRDRLAAIATLLGVSFTDADDAAKIAAAITTKLNADKRMANTVKANALSPQITGLFADADTDVVVWTVNTARNRTEFEFDGPNYEKADNQTTPAITGLESGTYVSASTATHDRTVHLYSDVDESTSAEFSKQYPAKNDQDQDNTLSAWVGLNSNKKPGTNEDEDVASLAEVTGTGSATSSLIAGKFDGVAGDFDCGALNCGTTPTGSWKFTPTDGTAKVYTDDKEYMVFGYWTTVDDDGMYTDFGTVYRTVGGSLNTGIFSTQGSSASYKGSAAGMYVKRSLDADDKIQADSGQFTADASLSANFETNTMTGTISSIMDGAMKPFGDIEVSLGSNDIDTSTGLLNSAGSTVTVKEDLLVSSGSGLWQAQLFGVDADDANKPVGVVGAFRVSDGLRDIAGAFGASKQAPASD